ncbi:unnamed protein product [Vitrella brassicaformis CCMP3155]|uniref:Peptidase S9 prolyl oligopeptidase catalytic domain-containing protein n=3 Tax=Vitrella brassicaformis TaxID=1169539 RepID=A0A0G4F972_VITBC|nr:unnamed protein product [Vitrella brassicaformis CCMP3155]|eukprot:CEM09172.1 unnamed protein product [Vitrella brassicaformis CCMP3155]
MTRPANGSYINTFSFSPDNKWVTYLAVHGASVRHLYAIHVDEGVPRRIVDPLRLTNTALRDEDLSLEEKLQRERARSSGLGVTKYHWSTAHNSILLPFGKALWIKSLPSSSTDEEPTEPYCLLDAPPDDPHPMLDALWSPDGQMVSLVRDKEVYVVGVEGEGEPGVALQLTSGARGNGGWTTGLAEYMAQEEMHRLRGYWWSPDSSYIAFCSFDESHIPAYDIVHQHVVKSNPAAEGVPKESHHFAFAGYPNAKMRLGVIKVPGKDEREKAAKDVRQGSKQPDCLARDVFKDPSVVWMDLGPDDEVYVARVDWVDLPTASGRPSLLVQLQNRPQTELHLMLFDTATGKPTQVHTEKDEKWVDLKDLFTLVGKEGLYLWGSDSPGITTLFLRSLYDRSMAIPLTPPTHKVISLVAHDTSYVCWQGCDNTDPCNHHIYLSPIPPITTTPPTPPPPVPLSLAPGVHQAIISPDKSMWIHQFSSINFYRGIWLRKFDPTSVLRDSGMLPNLNGGPAAGGVPTAGSSGTQGDASMADGDGNGGVGEDGGGAKGRRPPASSSEPSTQRPRVGEKEDGKREGGERPKVAPSDAGLGAVVITVPKVQAVHGGLMDMFYGKPHLFTCHNRTGTRLNGLYFLPDKRVYGEGPYPCIVSLYGGPGVQYVTNTIDQVFDYQSQLLRTLGFLVMKIDNRGSKNRDRDFEKAVHLNMGRIELEDQIDGVRHLTAIGLAKADPNDSEYRGVGIFGASYGGYMSAMAIFRFPEVFRSAVAVSPVTFLEGYSTHWTERYLSLPSEQPEAYHESSVLPQVRYLNPREHRLLLIHGLLDENVHFRHSAALIERMNDVGFSFDLMLFPTQRHCIRHNEKKKRLLRHFVTTLLPDKWASPALKLLDAPPHTALTDILDFQTLWNAFTQGAANSNK